MKNNIFFTIAGLLLSSAAIADTSFTEQHGLEKMILASAGQKLAAEAEKYTQIIALAGDKQDELAKSKDEVTDAYKKWHDLKSAVEASPSKASFDDFKAVEVAAQAYSEANKRFIAMQKGILTKTNVSSGDQAAYLFVMR